MDTNDTYAVNFAKQIENAKPQKNELESCFDSITVADTIRNKPTLKAEIVRNQYGFPVYKITE